ncbi:MAG TPA: hypothetical protein VNO55_21835 [Polyangia bacterium]|nr:hypothetical protein [Polyangia bacterium]
MSAIIRLASGPCASSTLSGTDTGYPWEDGDVLYADDLNKAFLPADGRLLPTTDVGLTSGAYWNNGGFVCIIP